MIPNLPILSSNRSAGRKVGTITLRRVYLAYDGFGAQLKISL